MNKSGHSEIKEAQDRTKRAFRAHNKANSPPFNIKQMCMCDQVRDIFFIPHNLSLIHLTCTQQCFPRFHICPAFVTLLHFAAFQVCWCSRFVTVHIKANIRISFSYFNCVTGLKTAGSCTYHRLLPSSDPPCRAIVWGGATQAFPGFMVLMTSSATQLD